MEKQRKDKDESFSIFRLNIEYRRPCEYLRERKRIFFNVTLPTNPSSS